jgi:hypothetical protein
MHHVCSVLTLVTSFQMGTLAAVQDRMTTMEAPDEDDEANVKFLTNITIPATFVTKSTGDALKALMKGGQPVYVVMDWQDILPKKQQVRARHCCLQAVSCFISCIRSRAACVSYDGLAGHPAHEAAGSYLGAATKWVE